MRGFMSRPSFVGIDSNILKTELGGDICEPQILCPRELSSPVCHKAQLLGLATVRHLSTSFMQSGV
jgi:hypothetical protein